MTTANDIITPALEKIGAHTRILRADPSLFDTGLKYLAALMEDLATDHVELGTDDEPVAIPSSLTDDINERSGAKQALIDVLAKRLVLPAKVEMLPAYAFDAQRAMADLRRRFLNLDIPSITPSRLMSRGQGNQRGVDRETFFRGEKLDADTTT